MQIQKRIYLIFLTAVCGTLLSPAMAPVTAMCYAKNSDSDQQIVRSEIERNKEAIAEIRRDQLNYRLEKDLLKEAYSSNLQTINVVITLILGVFTILGFVGIRSVSDIRKEFKIEIDQLQNLRSKFELKLAELERDQQQAMKKIADMTVVNAKQDERLQALELQEKVGSLIIQKDYRRALEYVNVGVSRFPDDLILLTQRADCLTNLSMISEAVIAWERVLEVEPAYKTAILDLCELYLFNAQPQKYEMLLKRNHDVLSGRSPYFNWYIESVHLYLYGNIKELRKHISTKLAELPQEPKKLIDGWRYKEVRTAIELKPDTQEKQLFVKVLDVLEGKITGQSIREIVI